MPIVINTNIASLNAQRNLSTTQNDLNVSLQRLSSGLRINSAKDDAAGLYVAGQMTRDIRGTNQAIRNAADGISLGQTAEGALGQISNNLQRMREIAVQAANGTVGDGAAGLQKEVEQLAAEIVRIINVTEFNGTNLLDGTQGTAASPITFQVGSKDSDTIDVMFTDLSGLQTAVAAYDVSTGAGATAALTALEANIDTVNGARADFGAIQNRFEAVISNLQNYAENLTASRSRIEDADFAAETAKLTRAQILQQAGTTILAQANSLPQNALTLLQG